MKNPSLHKLAAVLTEKFAHVDELASSANLRKSTVIYLLNMLSLKKMVERNIASPNFFKKRKAQGEAKSSWNALYRERIKYSRKIHNKRKEPEEECLDEMFNYHEHRKCRTCQGRLEKSRWWHCVKCVKELPSDAQDAFIYPSSNFEYLRSVV